MAGAGEGGAEGSGSALVVRVLLGILVVLVLAFVLLTRATFSVSSLVSS